MTFDPVQFIIGLGAIILSILLFLRFWQFLISLGVKDSKYPIVQHAERIVKEEKKPSAPFLEGSKIGKRIDEESAKYVEEVMKKGLHATQKKRAKYKRHPFVRDLMDIRRAIILDDLMDRKWKDPAIFPDSKGEERGDEWDKE